MTSKTIDTLHIQYTTDAAYLKMTYLLMPIQISDKHIAEWCEKCKSNIAIISGMDWDNDLTPWAAPGVPKGSEAFKGLAPEFLKKLQTEVIPEIETDLHIKQRNLIGVSLSGLFALWAWMHDDYFDNICSLSGSFWYEGFVSWFEHLEIPAKTGKILFELGKLEPQSKNKVFATVGTCTAAIVGILKAKGINTKFKWVEGTHYSPIEPRLDLAFAFLAE